MIRKVFHEDEKKHEGVRKCKGKVVDPWIAQPA